MFKFWVLYSYLRAHWRLRTQNRNHFLRWQEQKVLKHLEWIRLHSPYYRKIFSQVALKNYRSLPFQDKGEMMKHFSELNTAGIDRDEALNLALLSEENRDFSPTLKGITVGLSSGTSGNRGLFLASHQERAMYAGNILAKILPGSIFESYKVAFFMRANSNLYTGTQSSRIQFCFFDLLQSIELQLERLNHLKPDLLLAPPSMLLKIAEAKNAGKLHIHPRKIVSIAETLDPLDEAFLKKSFKQTIHQVYQCTEGFLGITCKQGTLHLNEDLTQIEPYWLNEEKTKFMPIITDFERYTQPLVRYRLNDILTLKTTPCPCGSHLTAIEMVEGRADDVLYFLSSSGQMITVFPDFIRRALIQSHAAIEAYWVIQRTQGSLEVILQCPEDLRPEIELAVLKEIKQLSLKIASLIPEVRFSAEPPKLQGKKLRRVIQEFRS